MNKNSYEVGNINIKKKNRETPSEGAVIKLRSLQIISKSKSYVKAFVLDRNYMS